MKLSLILIAFLSLGIIVQVADLTSQNVGGTLGFRGSNSVEHIPVPQKIRLIYGVGESQSHQLYPMWYYPSLMANNTAFNGMYQDPWVLAEFTSQPVMIISTSAGLLF